MSKQMTITIPDDLAKRLEKFKKSKNKINISKICQQALDTAIKESEQSTLKQGEDPDLEAIIQRLRKEKADSIHEHFLFGYSQGSRWAKNAKFQELMLMGEHWKTANEVIAGAKFDLAMLYEEYPYEFNENVEGYLARIFSDMYDWYVNFDREPRFLQLKYCGEEGRYLDHAPEDCPPEYRQFEDGFVQAVRDFWSQIKDRL